MKIIYKTFYALLLALVFQSIANASLIEIDLYSYGDKLITRDTDTGLDWLDLTSTLNISYDDMQTKISSGGEFEDFRYATTADIDRLQQSAGLPAELFFTSSSIYRQRVTDLIYKIGETKPSTDGIFTYGLTGDPFLPTTYIQDRIFRGFTITLGTSAIQGIIDDDSASISTGSWLIRNSPSPVPLPNALLLFISGFMFFMRRKIK